jgi:hypothetical protein
MDSEHSAAIRSLSTYRRARLAVFAELFLRTAHNCSMRVQQPAKPFPGQKFGGWPRSIRPVQTTNEGAPGPSHLGTGDITGRNLPRTGAKSSRSIPGNAPGSGNGLRAFRRHQKSQHLPAGSTPSFCRIYQSLGAQSFHGQLPPNQAVSEPRFPGPNSPSPEPQFKSARDVAGPYPSPEPHPSPTFAAIPAKEKD